MKKIVIRGGKRLEGRVGIGGSKNAALPLLFAGILSGEACVFQKLPRVSDILNTLEILKYMGARIRFYKSGEVRVDYRDVRPILPPQELTGAIRGSTYLLGSMLGRFGEAHLVGAGGCNFGTRPIDQHLLGFYALGARIEKKDGALHLVAPSGLSGRVITLAMPSVGATVNLMMAATAASGETLIQNAAAEPHVGALVSFLEALGARLECQNGKENTVKLFGSHALHGCEFTVIPDMIEAGTYLAFCMATQGCVTVADVNPADLSAVLDVLREMGGRVAVSENEITLESGDIYRGVSIETGPFPAFPTDLQPQFTALMAIGGRAVGMGLMRENVFDNRFQYTRELQKFGADIRVVGNEAHIVPSALFPTRATATDLRGGAALVLAALATAGESMVDGAALIGRGYEHLAEKLGAIGADIEIFG